MANGLVNQIASFSGERAEVIDASESYHFKRGDCGKTFFIESGTSTAYHYLPLIDQSLVGWHITCILSEASDGAVVFLKGDIVDTPSADQPDQPRDQAIEMLENQAGNVATGWNQFSFRTAAEVVNRADIYAVYDDTTKIYRWHVFCYGDEGAQFDPAS